MRRHRDEESARRSSATRPIVPPGKRAFPCHNHHINEEMFFVLEGQGEVRIGTPDSPSRRHDHRGPEVAHQIINTSNAKIQIPRGEHQAHARDRRLPRFEKFGILAEIGTGPDGKPQRFVFLGRPDGSLDYYDGE